MRFTHVFSSDLQRAYKTANAICLALLENDDKETEPSLKVISLPVLREQDFGFYEGKPFYTRLRDPNKSAKEDPRVQHRDDSDFKDIESKEAMEIRTKAFLEKYLAPIIQDQIQDNTSAVAVVSHGILLSHLWRNILQLLPRKNVALSPGLSAGGAGSSAVPLEHLGGWSNTGYLELDLQRAEDALTEEWQGSMPSTLPTESSHPKPTRADVPLKTFGRVKMVIKSVNEKKHLNGLKRTRGGVGSSEYDGNQKTIESFFKKRKL